MVIFSHGIRKKSPEKQTQDLTQLTNTLPETNSTFALFQKGCLEEYFPIQA